MNDVDTILRLIEEGHTIPNTPQILTICGSVRFMDEMLKWACYWTKRGFAVLMPHCTDHKFYHSETGDKYKNGLDVLHFKKIAISKYVFVVDINGYIGESTAREVRCAKALDVHIIYASKFKFPSASSALCAIGNESKLECDHKFEYFNDTVFRCVICGKQKPRR